MTAGGRCSPRRPAAAASASCMAAAAVLACLAGASAGSVGAADPPRRVVFPVTTGGQFALLSARLDRDLGADLVVLERKGRVLQVYLSSEIWPHLEPQGVGVGLEQTDPFAIHAFDMDGDAFLDVLVTDTVANSFSIAWGDGTGRFPVVGEQQISQEFVVTRNAVPGRFDPDPLGDLVIAWGGIGSVSIYAPYSSKARYEIVTPVESPEVAFVGDFDADGRDDFGVLGTGAGAHLAIYEGTGAAAFVEAATFESLPSPGGLPLAAVTADLDGRGGDDVAVLAADSQWGTRGFLYVVRGTGDGGYEAGRVGSTLDLGAYPVLEAADADGDGATDIAVATLRGDGEGEVLVFRNVGDGSLTFDAPCSIPFDAPVSALAIADFDVDGEPDFAAALPDLGRLEIVFSAHEECRAVASCWLPAASVASPGATSVAFSDIDSDGAEDLIVVGTDAVRGMSLETDGLHEAVRVPRSGGVSDVAIADADGDGASDVLVLDPDEAEIEVWSPGAPEGLARSLAVPTSPGPAGLCVADLDGDGRMDLAVGLPEQGSVEILLQEPEGGFSAGSTYPAGDRPTAVGAGDLDGDGIADLAVLDRGSTWVRLLRGLGGGAFSDPVPLRVVGDCRDLEVADADGDGLDDIVVASQRPSGVTVLVQTPGGFRTLTHALVPGSLPSAVRVEDVDGNGRPAIVTANAGSSSVSVLRPDGEGGFVEVEIAIAYRAEPSGDLHVAAGHADRDGRKDLAVSGEDLGDVRVLLAGGCGGSAAFRRGDVNGDGSVDVADPVMLLLHLFVDGSALRCEDSGDSNDSGALQITDVVHMLLFLFRAGPAPAAPGPGGCGVDPTEDGLSACDRACY